MEAIEKKIQTLIRAEMNKTRTMLVQELHKILNVRLTEKEAAKYAKMSVENLAKLRTSGKLNFNYRGTKEVKRGTHIYIQYSGITYSTADLDNLNQKV